MGIGQVTKRVDKHLRGVLTLAVLGKENTELQLQKNKMASGRILPCYHSLRLAEEKV